ncbi:PREDICTED: uncharacterized protein LOC106820212 [Priapulus caudatus]|uniref:Uncharacterized protein LOC106820212 n=1 Tax=Priapulus caudatus TaxID=37621 RepID=A0ABM1F718_PRICU|nr:PREDICTED: uncharacterized protein LOC106820212 [Priapulus caudatus]
MAQVTMQQDHVLGPGVAVVGSSIPSSPPHVDNTHITDPPQRPYEYEGQGGFSDGYSRENNQLSRGSESFGNTIEVQQGGREAVIYEVECMVTNTVPYPIVNFLAFPRKRDLAHPLEANILGNRGQLTASSDTVLNVVSDCDHNRSELRVTVVFNQPFRGRIYANGYHSIAPCTWNFNNVAEAFIQIPFTACGTLSERPQPGENFYTFKNAIVVMPSRPGNILTGTDRAYPVSCKLDKPNQIVSFKQNVNTGSQIGEGRTYSGPAQRKDKLSGNVSTRISISPKQTTTEPSVDEKKPDLPIVSMKVVQGTDLFATAADRLLVGQNSTLILYYEDDGYWDLGMGTCYAHDGSGYRKIELLDARGCPVYRRVGDVRKHRYGDVIYMFSVFEAFKFPDREQSYYECAVNVCKHECKPRDCTEARPVENQQRRALSRDKDGGVARPRPNILTTDFEESLPEGYYPDVTSDTETSFDQSLPGEEGTSEGGAADADYLVNYWKDKEEEEEDAEEEDGVQEQLNLYSGIRMKLPGDDDYPTDGGLKSAMLEAEASALPTSSCVDTEVFVIVILVLAAILVATIVIIAITCIKLHIMAQKKYQYQPSPPVNGLDLCSTISTPVIGGRRHDASSYFRPWNVPTVPLHADAVRAGTMGNMNVKYSIRNATSGQSHS